MREQNVLITVIRYIITNYEHSNFSVSQARRSGATQVSLIPIAAATSTSNAPINPAVAPAPTQTHPPHHGLSQTALAGTIAGTTAAVVLILIGLGLFLWRLRSQMSKGRNPSVEKSQIHYVFEKQELDGTAFTQPRSWYGCDFEDKRVELTNIEVVELPDQPVTHEIMSRPRKPWNPRRSKPGHNRKYNAYISIKKARDNRMSNGKVSPPISKYCRVSCAPFRGKVVDLNRTLPPTPIYCSPRNSWARTPMPKNRRARFPRENSRLK